MTDTATGLIRGFQAAAGLNAVLVFLQAVLAGQFQSGNEPDLRDWHEVTANVVFIVALGQLGLAWLTRNAWRYRMVAWSVVIVALVVAQIGLGYSGRDSADAAAIHIPLGVFIFSLTSIVAMLAMMDERAKATVKGERA